MSRTVTTDTSWYWYSGDYGVWLCHHGSSMDCFIVLSEKNPRIANTVVYIIACYVIYIILS